MKFIYCEDDDIKLIDLYGTDHEILLNINKMLKGSASLIQFIHDTDLYMFKPCEDNGKLVFTRICGCEFYSLSDEELAIVKKSVLNKKIKN